MSPHLERQKLSEADAYARLRKAAMDKKAMQEALEKEERGRLQDVKAQLEAVVAVRRHQLLGVDVVVGRLAAVAGSTRDVVAHAARQHADLLRDAAETMHLTARGYHRVLRVARTLADLDGADKVGRVHLAEALSYRALVDEVRRAA